MWNGVLSIRFLLILTYLALYLYMYIVLYLVTLRVQNALGSDNLHKRKILKWSLCCQNLLSYGFFWRENLPNLGEVSGDNVLDGEKSALSKEIGRQHLQLPEEFHEVVWARLVLRYQRSHLGVDGLTQSFKCRAHSAWCRWLTVINTRPSCVD